MLCVTYISIFKQSLEFNKWILATARGAVDFHCLGTVQFISVVWEWLLKAFHFTLKKCPPAWTDLENIMLSEISQLEKDKYHMISLICGISWTNWTNKQNRDRLIDGEQAESSGGVVRVWGDQAKKEKRTHEHGQQCGDCRGGQIRGIHGNGKKIQ